LGSIRPARLVLTSSAVGFIRARSTAVTMPRVASTRRMCKERTSQLAKKSALLPAVEWPSARARARDCSLAQTSTFIPKAFP
jgi:hypothetical protein